MRRFAALAGLALLMAACGGDEQPRLVVAAASSMREPLTGCSREFGGSAVMLSFAGSDELAAQMRQGSVPDIYAAANTALPRELAEEGRLRRPLAFATNELVLAVPEEGKVKGIAGLGESGVTLAVGSESVPLGAYTREALSRLGRRERDAILANVRSNEPDARGVVGKLTQGAVDAGFAYRTDVQAAGGRLRAIPLPARLRPQVTYAAGVAAGSSRPEEAGRYLRGLRRGACAKALRDAGFGPPPE